MFDDEMMVEVLQSIARMIAMLPADELRAHVEKCRNSINRAHSIGHIVDPTAYRNAMWDGTIDDAGHQLEIAEAILKARVAIDKREAFVAEIQKKKLSRR